MKTKILPFLKSMCILLAFLPSIVISQNTNYVNLFDYKNINTQTLVPVHGLNDTQRHVFTILKHSFEMQHIISYSKDTLFSWNGLAGTKTIYTTDSLILFFLRPNDTIVRPCILLTHGNDARYRSNWNEQMNFYAIDLAMRGYCVSYYENPSSFESKNINLFNSTRKAFYNGFQSAVAAYIYIIQNKANFKIDTSKMFSGGLSFGAFCSLSLASADGGINFTDTLFNSQGNFTAKSVYPNASFNRNIKRAFVIGGGLPKDDTIEINNSKMGAFLDKNDSNLAVLFLHGRNDNLVSFDVTKFGLPDTVGSYFYAEGPRAIINNIREKGLEVSAKLFVNCRGEHPFLTTVCGYNKPNCIQQYQWLYLNEPPNGVTSTSPYFTNNLNDTLLHYFAYMATQLDDINFIIGDFLQPAVVNTPSFFTNNLYFLQPQDSFTYSKPDGHWIFRNTDCEGNVIVVTKTDENYSEKNEITIYPNPVRNFIFLETKEIIQRIRIYSILGTLLKDISSNNLQEQIDISNLTNGEYVCVIQLKDKIITKKISVIH